MIADESTWVIYLLRCADGTLYCGCTNGLSYRLARHDDGTGAKYTKGRRPVTLAWMEKAVSRSAALKREAMVKRLPKTQKERMCEDWTRRGRRAWEE